MAFFVRLTALRSVATRSSRCVGAHLPRGPQRGGHRQGFHAEGAEAGAAVVVDVADQDLGACGGVRYFATALMRTVAAPTRFNFARQLCHDPHNPKRDWWRISS